MEAERLDLKEFASKINGKQYGHLMFSKEETDLVKENGIVIIYGLSDDLMEIDGAIWDEVYAYRGRTVYLTEDGLVEYDEELENGFVNENKKSKNVIHAIWCGKDENGETIPWTYETDIPHETFFVYEEEELFCIGIVFYLKDLKRNR